MDKHLRRVLAIVDENQENILKEGKARQDRAAAEAGAQDGDDDNAMRKKKNLMRWDVKKKKYVKAEQVRMSVTSRNEVAI